MEARLTWPLPNVWLGVSAENQRYADERIPLLLQCHAAVRFVSAEPLLGPVYLSRYLPARGRCSGYGYRTCTPPCPSCGRLHYWCGSMASLSWVIVGGESGPGARSCDVEWIRSIVAQCRAAEVPVFCKQLGARPRWGAYGGDWGAAHQARCAGGVAHPKGGDPEEWPEDLRVREMPNA